MPCSVIQLFNQKKKKEKKTQQKKKKILITFHYGDFYKRFVSASFGVLTSVFFFPVVRFFFFFSLFYSGTNTHTNHIKNKGFSNDGYNGNEIKRNFLISYWKKAICLKFSLLLVLTLNYFFFFHFRAFVRSSLIVRNKDRKRK